MHLYQHPGPHAFLPNLDLQRVLNPIPLDPMHLHQAWKCKSTPSPLWRGTISEKGPKHLLKSCDIFLKKNVSITMFLKEAELRARIHTYIHTYMHTYIQTYRRTHIQTCVHTYVHTYTHTYIHIRTHTHAHMYACTHTYITQNRLPGRAKMPAVIRVYTGSWCVCTDTHFARTWLYANLQMSKLLRIYLNYIHQLRAGPDRIVLEC